MAKPTGRRACTRSRSHSTTAAVGQRAARKSESSLSRPRCPVESGRVPEAALPQADGRKRLYINAAHTLNCNCEFPAPGESK